MCGRNPATTYVKITANSELIEYALYGKCAQEAGHSNFLYPFTLDFNGLLGNFFGNSVPEMTDTIRCPGCDSSFGGITQSGKIGCAECYNTFHDRMMPLIQRIHGNTKHPGKRLSDRALWVKFGAKLSAVPQEGTELNHERKELREAIESQDFERAAVLRDRIKALEGGGKA